MKTILYQPLFINPQAYFVFPQLYHIEKGDSYIEPANITGQLIINDLTKVLTSTPTLNVVQDTNQVDFGLFKGKHIRISQYTNIGAVVLGEWYIPGTPEPEQPDWFKESIVAWYSPYCKQGMTNFDVIESYADDFTKWRIENTGVTSTQKKIVIAAGTELKYNVAYKGFGNSIAEFDIKYTTLYQRIYRSGLSFEEAIQKDPFNKLITIEEESKTLKQWCEFYNMDFKLVNNRIFKHKWKPIEALTIPKGIKRNKN